MIRILKKGLHTSIQDLGRIGFRNYGLPVSGAMNSDDAKLSNVILGNNETDAVMEITLQGPKLQFLHKTQIAITGANLSPTLNGSAIEMNKSVAIEKGSIVSFGARINGVRSYLSVNGGFQTEQIFGSRSYYQGITLKEKIENEDELSFPLRIIKNQYHVHVQYQAQDYEQKELLVFKGPEFELLNEAQQKQVLTSNFTLGINNRMAYQLKELIANELTPIISSAVLPGTVQLTPSGKMLILMRDCQTTGGYPRIFQLSEQAINCLSQKMQHETIQFKLIT